MAKAEWQKAAEIVRDAGGRIVGRTKLQKVAYLLELAGLGEGFQFEYRHYGPYSENLASSMRVAEAFGLVTEEEHQADWGGLYSIYSSTGKIGERKQDARGIFAEAAAQIGAVELELAATAAYLFVVEGYEDPWAETARRKPEKSDGGRLAEARKTYLQLQKLRAPKPLPKLP